MSSGINFLLDRVDKRLEGTERSKTMLGNTKEVWTTCMEIMKEYLTAQVSGNDHNDKSPYKETARDMFSALGMIFGSAGGFLFAPQSRDSAAARLFGFFRNAGGLVADLNFVFGKDYDQRHKIVGSSCGVASFLNIIMRWVSNDKLVRALNHISIALDDFGLTYWANASKEKNDIQDQKEAAEKMQAEQQQPQKEEKNLTKNIHEDIASS